MITAAEAIAKLKEGNDLYISTDTFKTDISSAVLEHFARNGQEPYAIIISCSDSRVIPERIFGTYTVWGCNGRYPSQS